MSKALLWHAGGVQGEPDATIAVWDEPNGGVHGAHRLLTRLSLALRLLVRAVLPLVAVVDVVGSRT